MNPSIDAELDNLLDQFQVDSWVGNVPAESDAKKSELKAALTRLLVEGQLDRLQQIAKAYHSVKEQSLAREHLSLELFAHIHTLQTQLTNMESKE